MRAALIIAGRVQEIFPSRGSMDGKYHQSLIDAVIDIPDDVSEGDWQTATGWSAVPPQPPLTAEAFAAAIQTYIDSIAQAKGYADGVSFAGYVSSTVPAWAAEAHEFIAWRDKVWLYAYAELAKVQSGERPAPEVQGLIAELPAP